MNLNRSCDKAKLRFQSALYYLITIHGHVHSPTARRNSSIAPVVSQILAFLLELSHVLDAGAIGNISPIRKNMDSDSLAAVIRSTIHQSEQLVRPRMHTSIAQKPNEVKRSSVRPRLLGIFPAISREHRSGFEGVIHKTCTARNWLPNSEQQKKRKNRKNCNESISQKKGD